MGCKLCVCVCVCVRARGGLRLCVCVCVWCDCVCARVCPVVACDWLVRGGYIVRVVVAPASRAVAADQRTAVCCCRQT